jgi:hypothetical protein
VHARSRSYQSQLAELGDLLAKEVTEPRVHRQRGGAALATQSGKADTGAVLSHIDELDVRAVRLEQRPDTIEDASMRARSITVLPCPVSATPQVGGAARQQRNVGGASLGSSETD